MNPASFVTNLYVQPRGPRPDFRVVLAFLWNDPTGWIDTDGDSYNPASREWTELYCQHRAREDERLIISAVSNEPLILWVESELPELAARAAYFLALETNGTV